VSTGTPVLYEYDCMSEQLNSRVELPRERVARPGRRTSTTRQVRTSTPVNYEQPVRQTELKRERVARPYLERAPQPIPTFRSLASGLPQVQLPRLLNDGDHLVHVGDVLGAVAEEGRAREEAAASVYR